MSWDGSQKNIAASLRLSSANNTNARLMIEFINEAASEDLYDRALGK